MRIHINGQPAALTLENEKTVGDLLAGLEPWARDRGFHFYEARWADRVFVRSEDAELGALSLDLDGILDVVLAPGSEFAYRALGDISAYLDRLGPALEKEKLADLVAPLLDAHRFLSDALAACDGALSLGSAKEGLERLLSDLEIRTHRLKSAPEAEARKSLAACVDSLRGGFESLLERAYYLSFRNMLGDLTTPLAPGFLVEEGGRLLKRLAAVLPRSAAALQTGHDADAMRYLHEATQGLELAALLVDRSEKLLRIEGASSPDAGASEDLFAGIRNILLETEAALKDRDVSRFGDLVEYELADRLPELEALFASLASRFPERGS